MSRASVSGESGDEQPVGGALDRRGNLMLRAEMARKIVDQLASKSRTRGVRSRIHPAAVVGDFKLKAGLDHLRVDPHDPLSAIAEGMLQRIGHELVDNYRQLDGGVRAGDDVGDVAFHVNLAAGEPALE